MCIAAMVKARVIQPKSNTTSQQQKVIRPSDTFRLSAGLDVSNVTTAAGGQSGGGTGMVAKAASFNSCPKEDMPAVCIGVRTYPGE